MPCYHPWLAYQCQDGSVVSVERQGKGSVVRTLTLPCGQCVGCRLERSRQWAIRCMHEAQMHDRNCFVTLTYKGQVPDEGLRYRDFQLFMKRLRKYASGQQIRFYMCGEYGDEKGRPHFHACLFGYDFDDKVLFSNRGGNKLYTSKILEDLWKYGMCSIGEVTFESAAYVARYIMKKITGTLADDHYNGLTPEFCHMSLKPGIGSGWFEKFNSDIFPDGTVVVRGVKTKLPRYYDKLESKKDVEVLEEVKYNRFRDAVKHFEDQTEERLSVREQVAIARINQLKRNLGE